MSIDGIENNNGDLLEDEEEIPKNGPSNYLNAFLFVAGVATACIAEFTDLFGHQFYEIAGNHTTILTPKATAEHDTSFLIWPAIFVFEAVFVVAQLTPRFRVHDTVKKITPWFILNCTLQIAFFIAMCMDVWFPITAGLTSLNFVVLMVLIERVEYTGKRPFLEYWVLRAPFSMHAGYLLCLSIVYINSMLQKRPDQLPEVLVATSMTGMTAVLTLAVVFSMAVPRPDGFFSVGVGWAYWWAFQELNYPVDGVHKLREFLPEEAVSNEVLTAFGYAAASLCFIAACLVILSFLLRLASCCQRNRV